jgi:hypothetical protein
MSTSILTIGSAENAVVTWYFNLYHTTMASLEVLVDITTLMRDTVKSCTLCHPVVEGASLYNMRRGSIPQRESGASHCGIGYLPNSARTADQAIKC